MNSPRRSAETAVDQGLAATGSLTRTATGFGSHLLDRSAAACMSGTRLGTFRNGSSRQWKAPAMQGAPPAIHVTPYGSAWAVRRTDQGEPISEHSDRTTAIAEGRRHAAASGVALVVYDEEWVVVMRVTPDDANVT